jgi:hypothetical protein
MELKHVSIRARAALVRAGLTTVEEVVAKGDLELVTINGVAQPSVDKIRRYAAGDREGLQVFKDEPAQSCPPLITPFYEISLARDLLFRFVEKDSFSRASTDMADRAFQLSEHFCDLAAGVEESYEVANV